MDRNIINMGQPITFTIRTVNTNFVFANVGGVIVQGTRLGTVATATPQGQTAWQLIVNPVASQTVRIYANTTNTATGAAFINIPVAVNASAQQPMGQQSSRHRIYSVTETASTTPNTVTLNVVTDAAARSMWIRLGADRYILGTLVSQTPTQINWQVTYRPLGQFAAHYVQVSANHAYVADQFVVSQNFLVNPVAPAPSPTPAPASTPFISRTSIASNALNFGERTTITVRTNLDVAHVWAEVDNRRVNARRGSSTATARTWTIDVSPNRTQTITIFANSTNSERGADTDSIRVTVRDSAPEIDSVVIRNSLILFGQMTTIDVRTNAEVNYVWAIVDGQRISGRRDSTSSNTRTWVIDVMPERSQSIRVYANRQNHREQGADVFTVNVTVN